MILKRQEKDGIIKALYESTNVLASIYDTKTSELILIFKSGARYKYPNVSKTDYMRFEMGESQGSVFNKYIKKYIFERMDDVDPTKILNEAETLVNNEKEESIKRSRNELVNNLNELVSYSNGRTDWTPDVDLIFCKALALLATRIETYLSLNENYDHGKVI